MLSMHLKSFAFDVPAVHDTVCNLLCQINEIGDIVNEDRKRQRCTVAKLKSKVARLEEENKKCFGQF